MSFNSLNLPVIDQEQALSITRFFIKNDKNVFIFGQKGTGKTEIAMQAIKDLNYNISYVNLSVLERPDLAGYPDIHSNSEVITYKSPFFLPPSNGKPNTVILFDEVDKASPEITAPLLELLQFKKINGKPINCVSCILTGNLLNERSFSNEISRPLLDRGAKFILEFSLDKWIDWAKLNDVNELILGFLINNPEFSSSKIDDASYASPSARSWTLASKALNDALKSKIIDIETISLIISSFVGTQAGLRFKNWFQYYKKFELPIHSLIKTGSLNIDFNSLHKTEQVVFCISLCQIAKNEFLKSKNKNIFYIDNLCDFFTLNNVDKEIQLISLNNSFPVEVIAKNKLYACKKFYDLYSAINQNLKK